MELVKIKAAPRDRLRVYLNDHLAGAVGGIRLARRCRDNNGGTELAAWLEGFIADLRDDYATLRALIGDLGLPVARPKQLGAMAAEWVGRLKLNGQLSGYSPLGRLVELEVLCAGVDAKRSLWLSLREVSGEEPLIGALDLDALVSRASAQRDALEKRRRTAAALALGTAS